MLGEQVLQYGAAVHVRLGEQFAAARLEDVEGDEVGGQRGRELLDRAAAGGGAVLQRLEGQPPLRPDDELAVEDQAVRQLRGGGWGSGAESGCHAWTAAAPDRPAGPGRGEQKAPVAVELGLEREPAGQNAGAGDGLPGLGEHRLRRGTQHHQVLAPGREPCRSGMARLPGKGGRSPPGPVNGTRLPLSVYGPDTVRATGAEPVGDEAPSYRCFSLGPDASPPVGEPVGRAEPSVETCRSKSSTSPSLGSWSWTSPPRTRTPSAVVMEGLQHQWVTSGATPV